MLLGVEFNVSELTELVCIEKDILEIVREWSRSAVDVTHVKDEVSGRIIKYLTIVDCSPSRFAVWKRIRDESTVLTRSDFTWI